MFGSQSQVPVYPQARASTQPCTRNTLVIPVSRANGSSSALWAGFSLCPARSALDPAIRLSACAQGITARKRAQSSSAAPGSPHPSSAAALGSYSQLSMCGARRLLNSGPCPRSPRSNSLGWSLGKVHFNEFSRYLGKSEAQLPRIESQLTFRIFILH